MIATLSVVVKGPNLKGSYNYYCKQAIKICVVAGPNLKGSYNWTIKPLAVNLVVRVGNLKGSYNPLELSNQTISRNTIIAGHSKGSYNTALSYLTILGKETKLKHEKVGATNKESEFIKITSHTMGKNRFDEDYFLRGEEKKIIQAQLTDNAERIDNIDNILVFLDDYPGRDKVK